ncbi:MAG TPA: HAMP domain-containing sensor histidine kinase [Puia sp.]|nr:HAMP domain-containing sensor histidine kinase [Puia sp.]
MPKRIRIGIPLAAPLMILTIVGLVSFQVYWMWTLYAQEWAELRKETDIAFRDVIYRLQMQQLQKDSLFIRHDLPPNLFLFNFVDSLRERMLVDSPGGGFGPNLPPGKHKLTISIEEFEHDTAGERVQGRIFSVDTGAPHRLHDVRSRLGAGPPLTIAQIDTSYRMELAKNHIGVPFRIERIEGPAVLADRPVAAGKIQTNFLYVGLSKDYAYRATFGSPTTYILGRMRWPIAMGMFLTGLTAIAFVVLYRSLRQQRRLAQYKNDFISNMTHELKTPISTINVAIEALRNFDALDDPKRTREYLDISAIELHRLSLLVEKVLRLSEFENKEVEFQLTVLDLRELVAEVVSAMRLPFEKAGAVVRLAPGDGRYEVRGDKSHLSSVISNLLDNALKYSKEDPVIAVQVWREDGMVMLSVTDNGIGIPAAYQRRIFDKFFRVPSDDHHNIKGYGLGLNYVHEIIHIHRGVIGVESKEGKGSAFTVQLPAV